MTSSAPEMIVPTMTLDNQVLSAKESNQAGGAGKIYSPKGASLINTLDSDFRGIGSNDFLITAGDGAFTVTAGDKAVTITESNKAVTIDHKRFASTVLRGRELKITNEDIAVLIDTGGKDVLDLGAKRMDNEKKQNRNSGFANTFRKKFKKHRTVNITAGRKTVVISIEDVAATINPGERAVAIAPGTGAVTINAEDQYGSITPGVEALKIIPRGGLVTINPLGGAITITLGEGDVTIIHEGGNTTTARMPNTSVLGGRVVTIVERADDNTSLSTTEGYASPSIQLPPPAPLPQRSFHTFFNKKKKQEVVTDDSMNKFFTEFYVDIENASKSTKSDIYDLLNSLPEEQKTAASKVGNSWMQEFGAMETKLELSCKEYIDDAVLMLAQLQRLRDGEHVIVQCKLLFEPVNAINNFRNLVLELVAVRRALVDKRDGFQELPLNDSEVPELQATNNRIYDICNKWINTAIGILEDHGSQVSERVEVLRAEYSRLLDGLSQTP